MFRIPHGFSVLLFLSILWLFLCVQCRELDDIEIREAGRERSDLQTSFRRTEGAQVERIRHGKFEERTSLNKATRFFRNGNNSFIEAVRFNRPEIESLNDFRMLRRDSRSIGLNSRFERGSRVRSRDFEEMLFLEEISLRDEKSSRRRVREERQTLNRRTDSIRFREFSSRRSEDRRTFEPERRMMLSRHNRDSRRVREGTESREVDSLTRSRRSRSRRSSSVEFSILDTISGFIELCYNKMKENLTTILVSVVFLLDFVNELVLGKKNTKSILGKSAIAPETISLTKIF